MCSTEKVFGPGGERLLKALSGVFCEYLIKADSMKGGG